MSSSTHRTHRIRLALCASLILITASVVFLASTRWGVGTSSDSAHYIRSARHLLDREEILVTIDAKGTSAHYPPLYPAMLALFSLGGADPLHAARWLHLVLFLANVSLVGWLVYRFTHGNVWAAATAAMLVIVSPASLMIHTMALSEPLFIFLSFTALVLLGEHIERPRAWTLLGAAIATSLAMMTRYAGAALIPAGAIALFWPGPNRSRRWFDSIAYAGLSVLPAIIWTIRNKIVMGTTVNREVTFHLISINHLKMAVETTSGWIVGVGDFNVIRAGITMLAIVALTGAIWAARGIRLTTMLTLFISCFFALLIASISFVDFHTPLDDRILAPVYLAAVVLVAGVLGTIRSQPLKLVCVGVGLVLCIPIGVRGARLMSQLHADGSGYARRIWRESPTIEAVRSLPPDTWIYSNAADAVYLMTGRLLSIPIPAKSVASSLGENVEYEQQLEAMRQQVVNNGAVIISLERYEGKRWYYPTGEELKKRLGLHRRTRLGDGIIYDYVAPTSNPATTEASP